MQRLPRIPSPPHVLWREFRTRQSPFVAFALIFAAVVSLWRAEFQPAPIAGRVQSSDRIVAYLNPAARPMPATNALVEIRTRTHGRKKGSGRVVAMGQPVDAGPADDGPPSGAGTRPVYISMPPGLSPDPGEWVDVRFAQ